jgi:GNAT superfamily N-acetyltransferase
MSSSKPEVLMESILHDLSNESLVQAIEEDVYALGDIIAERCNLERGRTEAFEWVCRPGSIWPNHVYRIHFAENSVDDGLRQAIGEIAAGRLPQTWILGPSARPAGLERLLRAQEFTEVVPWAGMAMDLERLQRLGVPPNGFSVRPITDDKTLRQWAAVMVPNLMGGQLDEVGPVYDVLRWMVGHPAFQFFAVEQDRQVIATSLLFYSGGVAGLHMISTQERFRGQGAGRLVTLAPLHFARAKGYRVGVLQASPEGAHLYQKLGFREYCRMGLWMWRAGGEGASVPVE